MINKIISVYTGIDSVWSTNRSPLCIHIYHDKIGQCLNMYAVEDVDDQGL